MAQLTQSIMQKAVKSVRTDMSLADLDRWLLENRVSGAPVIDEGGVTVGVVTRSDIARQVAVGLTLTEVVLDFYGDYSIRGPAPQPGEEMQEATNRLRDLTVGDAMSSRIISVGPDTPLDQTARVLLEHDVHRVLVQDANGRLVGIVSALDLVRLVANGSV